MQPTIAGSSSSSSGGGGGGGAELSCGGLARFQSAPTTWLEALLEEEEEEEDPLKRNSCLTELLGGSSVAAIDTGKRNSGTFASTANLGLLGDGSARFLRQNSSPAEFLGNSGVESDGYFSSFGIPASFDYLSPNSDVSSASKRLREVDSPLKQEQSSQESGGVSSLIDMEIDKLFEDSVPCSVRAKRGCATHPRSIAERVRRTRISDRIRKLQELVPNIDKQTNTADMLDEALEYVKLLQRQIQELTEHQKNCKCTAKDILS